MLKHAHIVNLHLGRSAIKGSDLVDVPDCREVAADCEIEEDEIILA